MSDGEVADRVESVQAAAGEGGSYSSAAATYEGIAVLGSHPHTKRLAPFDGSWLIYACSPDNTPAGYSDNACALPRVDVWFEVHLPVFDRTRPYPYLGWIAENTTKIYMRDRVAMQLRHADGTLVFPNAVLYPEKEFKKIENFGPFHFTSSIAYQLAMAIYDISVMKAAKPVIGLWGIMQQTETEYFQQRPGVQHMIVEANRRGIKVVAPEESRLFEPPQDGF